MNHDYHNHSSKANWSKMKVAYPLIGRRRSWEMSCENEKQLFSQPDNPWMAQQVTSRIADQVLNSIQQSRKVNEKREGERKLQASSDSHSSPITVTEDDIESLHLLFDKILLLALDIIDKGHGQLSKRVKLRHSFQLLAKEPLPTWKRSWRNSLSLLSFLHLWLLPSNIF